MKKLVLISVVFASTLMMGCSINHPVAKDYDQHLVKYDSEVELPKSDLDSNYSLDESTEAHSYQFRAATVGYAHVWIVEFGKILDKTLHSGMSL